MHQGPGARGARGVQGEQPGSEQDAAAAGDAPLHPGQGARGGGDVRRGGAPQDGAGVGLGSLPLLRDPHGVRVKTLPLA